MGVLVPGAIETDWAWVAPRGSRSNNKSARCAKNLVRANRDGERPPGRAPATNCAHEPGGLSLTRPFGPPSPGGRGRAGAAYGRGFMGSWLETVAKTPFRYW